MREPIRNHARRQQVVKQILQQLHEGITAEEMQHAFGGLLKQIGATDIAEFEQELIEEGMPEEEIQRLCDVHVAVFRQALDGADKAETTSGHAVHTFLTESAAAGQVLDARVAPVILLIPAHGRPVVSDRTSSRQGGQVSLPDEGQNG